MDKEIKKQIKDFKKSVSSYVKSIKENEHMTDSEKEDRVGDLRRDIKRIAIEAQEALDRVENIEQKEKEEKVEKKGVKVSF